MSGLLLAASFPRFGHPAIAWVALVPLLGAVWRAAAGRAPAAAGARGLRLGLTTGVVYFAGTVYWTADVLVTFGGLPRVPALGATGLLVAYLALYPALFGFTLARLVAAAGLPALWWAPALWVGTEHLRGWLFTGFPWVALGYSQARVVPVAQLASVGGVALLSLLVAAVSTGLVVALVARGRLTRMAASGGVLAVVFLVVLWGQQRVARGELTSRGTPLRVGVAQGNVPQDEKWEPARAPAILDRYLALTRTVAEQGAALVVWPESSTPFYFEHDLVGQRAILDTARATGAWLLVGSDQVEPGHPRQHYNAAFLVSPDGRVAGVYRKIHLVPFGEYVPLRRLLFFVAPVVDSIGDFARGDEVTVFGMRTGRFSTAICYESVFPSLARAAVDGGSQLLTTITNDAWYGWSSAPYQHYEQGTLRAIEFGRYLVRAANTGISAVVDPYGRVLAHRGLYETGGLVADVRLLEARTIYARIGDSCAWACVAVLAAALLVVRPGARPRRAPAR